MGSIVGTTIIALAMMVVILKGTILRAVWARDFLALIAIGGFLWAISTGDIFATDQLVNRFLPAATSIPNLGAVILLFIPTNADWFGESALRKADEDSFSQRVKL